MINNYMDDELSLSLDNINVRYFKLMNGESIISYVRDDIDSIEPVIHLEEPMVVSMDPSKQFTLSKWLPFSDNVVHKLDVYNVIMETNVSDDVKAHYLKIILDGQDEEEIELTPGVTQSKALH